MVNHKYATPPDHFTLMDSNGKSSTTKAFYFSTLADADNNNDGKITGAEADPPYSPRFGNFAYQTIARGQPVTTLVTAEIRILQSLPGDKPYVPNDCLVPVYSAQYVGFQEIHSYQLTDGRDHGTIREPDVATLVLQNITMAESQQQQGHP